MFDEVVALRRKGLSYNKIIEEVLRRHGVRLSKSHVSEWLRGIHSPYKGRYIPTIELLRPSEEFSYIIGVVIGDGYVRKIRRVFKGYSGFNIGLEVKDREFAEEFAKCLTIVLGRRHIKPYLNSLGRYVVETESRTLYELLRKPADLNKLKPYLEHCERCTAAFLSGFADSEGHVKKSGYILYL